MFRVTGRKRPISMRTMCKARIRRPLVGFGRTRVLRSINWMTPVIPTRRRVRGATVYIALGLDDDDRW